MTFVHNTFARIAAKSGLASDQALLLAGVCAFFFLLPLRTDATATISVMTALAIWAGKKNHVLGTLVAPGNRLAVFAFIFFLCVALLASLLNPSTLSKFPRILLWGCCVFSGAMLSACLPREKSVYLWALFAGIAGGFFVAVVFLGYDSPSIWHAWRLKLFAVHPSRLALYCAVCFFFVFYRSIAGNGAEKFAAAAAALLLMFIVLQTNTRGNLLMLPLGVVCLGATLPRRVWKKFAAVLLVCILVAGCVLWANRGTPTVSRLVSAVANVKADPTFRTRLPIWEIGWDAFTQSPIIGHGHQSYRELHKRYLAENKEALDARYNGFYEPSVKQAHNLILGRLVETGIVGTAAFFLFYGCAVVAAWRGPENRRWLVAPLVFYVAMSMLDDGLFRMNDAFILFLAGSALTPSHFSSS